MLGDLVGDLLAGLLVPGGGSADQRRAGRAERRLRAGREVRIGGAGLAGRAVEGTVRLRPGVAWWRPDPAPAAGEVLLCDGGRVEAVRPAGGRESGSPGRMVVTLVDGTRRSSVVVPAPYVGVVRRAFA